MQLTKNFSRSELECPCGCGACYMEPEFMNKLQALRDELGSAITVTSGYRCVDHNREVDGAAHSQHLYGKAADLAHPWMDLLADLAKKYFTNVVKGPGFVHVDIGPKRFWTYGAKYGK